ncbi:MAG: hypothetical protein ABW003_05835 [Microvirga sp.]
MVPDRQPTARERAAQELALTYIDRWSASNEHTLAATLDFYAPRVRFHGRATTRDKLLAEKRRLVLRWPERRYLLRPDTMRVNCRSGERFCTVRSAFDYLAENPERGQQSRGIATIEFVVHFAGERPLIVAESSRIRRGPNRPSSRNDVDE